MEISFSAIDKIAQQIIDARHHGFVYLSKNQIIKLFDPLLEEIDVYEKNDINITRQELITSYLRLANENNLIQNVIEYIINVFLLENALNQEAYNNNIQNLMKDWNRLLLASNLHIILDGNYFRLREIEEDELQDLKKQVNKNTRTLLVTNQSNSIISKLNRNQVTFFNIEQYDLLDGQLISFLNNYQYFLFYEPKEHFLASFILGYVIAKKKSYLIINDKNINDLEFEIKKIKNN